MGAVTQEAIQVFEEIRRREDALERRKAYLSALVRRIPQDECTASLKGTGMPVGRKG